MWIARGVLGRETDQPEQLDDSLPLAAGVQTMEVQRFREHVADCHARIERAVRVLEDDLHLAAQRAHLALFQCAQLAAVEPYLARRGLEEPQQQPPGGRFAAARLAHQRQRLAGMELEADAVHRLDAAAEVLDQPLRAQQRRHSGARQQAAK